MDPQNSCQDRRLTDALCCVIRSSTLNFAEVNRVAMLFPESEENQLNTTALYYQLHETLYVLHNRCNENHHCNPVTWTRMNMVGYFLSAPKPSLKPQNTFRVYFGRADSGELLIQS